jgi:hypothetical protein
MLAMLQSNDRHLHSGHNFLNRLCVEDSFLVSWAGNAGNAVTPRRAGLVEMAGPSILRGCGTGGGGAGFGTTGCDPGSSDICKMDTEWKTSATARKPELAELGICPRFNWHLHQRSAMSNDTKSRIMLWLFILLLCMFSFFAGRVTRADTYMAPTTPTALDVKIDALKAWKLLHSDFAIT